MASGFLFVFFLCMTSGLLIEGTWSTRVKRGSGCPGGWAKYGSRCFIVQTSRKTMADAELSCIALGGNLASVHSYGEQCFIRHLIFERYRSHVTAWIGMFDAVQEGKWLWTDGSKVRFTYWGHGEPNNVGGEHCTEVNWRGTHWNDLPCHFQKPFVCARKL